MSWLQNIQSRCSQMGINLFGIADGTHYQNILPDCTSVIVIANGGSEMWEHFLSDIQKKPKMFIEQEHPLDTWIQNFFEKIDPKPPSSRKWIRCAATDDFFDFRPLAIEAGLGHHSHMGLVIHPKYGLWISLRAAIFTKEYFEPTLLNAENRCDTCPKFCAQSCPGNAFTKNGWAISTCASFHHTSARCETSCQSRLSCPIGREYQHSRLAHHYHSNKLSGRKAICEILGVKDQSTGKYTDWKTWKRNSG